MVALSVLLPLLLQQQDEAEHLPSLLTLLSSLGVHTDADLLFARQALPPEADALRPKIQSFLASEGRSADALYLAALDNRQSETLARTGCGRLDDTLLDGGFRPGEVVELTGGTGSGKTFLSLQTVLRTLLDNPDAFALWLDTTSTFSAERAQKMLAALANERRDSISVDTAAEDSRPPLDRLIVARSFELGSITRLVQKVAKEGFPGDAAVDEKADEEQKEEMRVDVVPETAEAADAAPSLTGGYARLQDSPDAQPAQGRPRQLRFVVIDSVTPVFRTLLNAVSAEGHAKMVSFMRLLRSLPCVTLLTNNTTTSAPNGPGLSVFPSLRGTKPALGPTFTYLCDWTIWIGRTGEAFPASRDERGRVVEVWRSRRAPAHRWTAFEMDGVNYV